MIGRASMLAAAAVMPTVLATGGALAGPDAERGARLWRKEGSALPAFRRDGRPLRGPLPACAGCHGANAEGGNEGGLIAPPLPPGLADGDRLADALVTGLGMDGRALGPGMPRYYPSPADLADLTAFLRDPDTVSEPGVGQTSLRLGQVLPPGLNGPAAAVEAVFAAAAPVDGRRLVRVPIVWSVDPDELRARIEAANVFLLLDGLKLPFDPDLPELAPLDRSLDQEDGRWTLRPGGDFGAMAVALLQDAASRGSRRVVLFAGDAPSLRAAANEAISAATALGLPLVRLLPTTPDTARFDGASLLLLLAPAEALDLLRVVAGSAAAEILAPLELLAPALTAKGISSELPLSLAEASGSAQAAGARLLLTALPTLGAQPRRAALVDLLRPRLGRGVTLFRLAANTVTQKEP